MPGFTSYDDLITQITVNGFATDALSNKIGSTMQGAGFWHRTWIAVGTPAAGGEPAASCGSPCLSASRARSPSERLGEAALPSSHSAASCAVDRAHAFHVHCLVGVGGLSSASTGSKTVSSASLTRFCERSSASRRGSRSRRRAGCGAGRSRRLLSYTGDVNGAAQVGGSFTWPAAATVKDAALGPLPLAAGDTGCKACSTINVGARAAAGVFEASCKLAARVLLRSSRIRWNERDLVLQLAALPQVFDTACLGFYALAQAVTAATFNVQLRTAYE